MGAAEKEVIADDTIEVTEEVETMEAEREEVEKEVVEVDTVLGTTDHGVMIKKDIRGPIRYSNVLL